MKHVLITGGNKGIGLATTELFLENNYKVTVLARDFSSFHLNHPNLNTYSYDLADINNISNIFSDIGSIDILVNNAGIMYGIPYSEYTAEKKENMIRINLEAPVCLIEQAFTLNKEIKVVNLASIAGQIGHPDIWYGVTKAGIINLTKSLAKAMGPQGAVINCIAPGPVKTDMLDTIPQARKDALKSATISGDFATPDDIAKSIYWLATDAPNYINGFCVDLNNGMFPR